MGSLISVVVANLYMEKFESEALQRYPSSPRAWKCYVDDTFAVINHFLQFSDQIHEESDNSIAFLDVKVTRQPDGSTVMSVYQKPTHTDQYLHYFSHHHTHLIVS